MKIAPVLAAALVIYIAIPGSNQGKGKPKPKFCTGKDGNQYKKGESYEDEEACIRYTCKKKGKTFKMKEEKIQCTESEPDLAANMTAIEASMKLLNGSMESMETKLEDLQSNVESLQSNVESLQTSVESILGMMTAMQSTSSKHEVNITSNMEAISSNKASIVLNKVDISTNNNGINTNKDTCSAIETTAAKLETCLGDVNSTDCPSSEDGKISVVDAIKGNKEDIEALENPPKFNLVLIAGYNDGGKLATSEIMSPGGVCSQGIPPFPVAVNAHQSVYFNNTLMVCGGHRSGFIKKCYQLRDSNSEWTEGPAMNTPRNVFSMTKAGQDLYALGGYNGGADLDSMEKLSGSSGEWTLMAQKLTSPRRAHCTVFMETTRSLVIIGGYPSTNLVEEFSVATSTWKELAPLPVGLQTHGCVVLGQTLVVTGGYSSGAFPKKVYTFAGGQWATAGEMQQARYGHCMGTLDNKVLVLGGLDAAGNYVDTVQEMQQDGSFRIMDWKLKEKRGHFTATQVPREMFPCL